MEAGFGGSSQYESLNLVHYSSTYYVNDYAPELKKWTHFAVSCVNDSNSHRCPFYANGVQIYELPRVGKYGNF